MDKTSEYYRELVTKVFNAEADGIVKELGLSERPILEFYNDETSDSIMHVMCYYTAIPRNSCEKEIIEVSTDNILHVNCATTGIKCESYRKAYGGVFKDEDLIAVFLYHECRHIWQSVSKWHIGRRIPTPSYLNIELEFLGFDKAMPHEKDADNWAISYCKDKKRKFLAEQLHKEVKDFYENKARKNS